MAVPEYRGREGVGKGTYVFVAGDGGSRATPS